MLFIQTRDWNEELQTTRELARKNLPERLLRERAIFKVSQPTAAVEAQLLSPLLSPALFHAYLLSPVSLGHRLSLETPSFYATVRFSVYVYIL